MLNDIETQLLTLALDKGAQPGEIKNSALILINKLRNRGATVDEFAVALNPDNDYDNSEINTVDKYGTLRMPFGKYEGKMLLDIPENYLIWVLMHCRNITPGLRGAISYVLDDG